VTDTPERGPSVRSGRIFLAVIGVLAVVAGGVGVAKKLTHNECDGYRQTISDGLYVIRQNPSMEGVVGPGIAQLTADARADGCDLSKIPEQ
jgi:hypothetical protein